MNNTSDIDFGVDSSYSDFILVIGALLLSVFIIFANGLTIFIIRTTPRLQTLSNIYVMSLAVSDLVVGLGLVPLSIFYVPYIRKNYYDHNVNFCVFVFGINLGMAIVSSLHMSLIATDRYAYIIWPYCYQRHVDQRLVGIILCCAWVVGVLYALLPQIIHNEESAIAKCDITLAMPVEYLFYSTSCVYGLCVLVDLVMYTQILYTAHKQRSLIVSAPTASTQSRRHASESFSISFTETTGCGVPESSSKCGMKNDGAPMYNSAIPYNNNGISIVETSIYDKAEHCGKSGLKNGGTLVYDSAIPYRNNRAITNETPMHDRVESSGNSGMKIVGTSACVPYSNIGISSIEASMHDKVGSCGNSGVRNAEASGHEESEFFSNNMSNIKTSEHTTDEYFNENRTIYTERPDHNVNRSCSQYATKRFSVKSSHHRKKLNVNPQMLNKDFPATNRRDSSYLKSVKFFLTVFGVHFICLTPTVVCMGIDYYRTVPRILYNMFNLLALLNSGMNFIIFYFLNAKFRMAVLSLFRCRGAAVVPNATDASYLNS